MNYIHKLNDQIARLDQQRAVAWDQLFELKKYITSGKFNCGNELDGYVNVKDVLDRLAQIDLNNNIFHGKTYHKIGLANERLDALRRKADWQMPGGTKRSKRSA